VLASRTFRILPEVVSLSRRDTCKSRKVIKNDYYNFTNVNQLFVLSGMLVVKVIAYHLKVDLSM